MSPLEFSTIARRIAEAIPDDAYEQNGILQQVYQLRDAMQRRRREEPARRLDAVAVLLEVLGETAEVSPEEVFGVIGPLVLHTEMQVESDSIAAPLPEPEESTEPECSTFEKPISLKGPTPAPVEEPERPEEPESPRSSDSLFTEDLPGGDSLLGTILENLGTITSEQLQHALDIQRETGGRFGDALIRIGAASVKQVQRALGIQNHLRHGTMKTKPDAPLPTPRAPEKEISPHGTTGPDLAGNTLIGDIFLQLRYATEEQLSAALSVQHATGVRLGEVLVDMGFVSWHQVEQAVEAQRKLRLLPELQIHP
jgi:hypothetical protein